MKRLGELEAQVMEKLWSSSEPMSVRAVLKGLNRKEAPAYTTIMTVLDNLHRKEMVERYREGRAYLYRPAMSRVDFDATRMAEVYDQAGDREAVLLKFVDSVSEDEADQIRRLLGGTGGH
ncbi:BlaI/MecI/CopY family transcriptional regulator [Haloglycomyces albus]|uniref:BlaI/MecI/CopY family transcriptional regulator n=1 Tax=Haloglycomyces albus TaxID=526067 RepID=UPI00046CB4D9|nr:BlaI/MecI/CopY family transcriptional regulator [Haloglycomyces albus]